MGYYTRYELKAEPRPDGLAALIESDELLDLSSAVEPDGSFADSAKWYDHEEEMAAISLRFPGVLFTLTGEGEEVGDAWVKYFRDGKVQACRAVLTFPPFDESKWEDVKL